MQRQGTGPMLALCLFDLQWFRSPELTPLPGEAPMRAPPREDYRVADNPAESNTRSGRTPGSSIRDPVRPPASQYPCPLEMPSGCILHPRPIIDGATKEPIYY